LKREKRRGGPGRKSSKKEVSRRERKRCEAEGMTELVAMATPEWGAISRWTTSLDTSSVCPVRNTG